MSLRHRVDRQSRPMVILEMELWDKAGSGGEETRMRMRGLTRNEW